VSGLSVDDETVTAVRGALMRMCYVGGAVFLVLTVAGLMAQFKAASAALGLAIAAVAAASVRVDGGNRRRADLGKLEVADGRASRLLIGATALGALVFTVAVVLAVFDARLARAHSHPVLDWDSVMPAVEYYTLHVLAAASLLLAVAAWLGCRRVLRRQSLAGADTSVDHALRQVSTRRIAAGALGGQIMLLGTAVTAAPLLAQTTSPAGSVWQGDPQMVETASDVGLVVVIAGLAITAASLLRPFWSVAAQQPGHAPTKVG
jgi:hypothetical protein